MQYFKKIGSKIIWPGIAVMVLLIAASVLLLCYTVLCGKNGTIISYLAYMLSTYTLIMVICRIIRFAKGAKKAAYANPHTNRFLTDVPYRIRISLYGSFIMNLAYAFVKLVSSMVYRSVWFGAIAVYYIFGENFQFVKFMNSATGCMVCLLIFGTAFYMIVNASRRLRALD